MPVRMLTMHPGELEVRGPVVTLILPADPKSQAEDWGEVDEEGGHLYECIKIIYEEDYHPKPVHTHGMVDALALVSSLSSFYLNPKFHLCPSQSILVYPKAASHFYFQNVKDLLLKNDKHLQLQDRKVQILAAIPITADEGILWDVRVPDTDIISITGVTTSSLWEPREAMPQSPRSHVGTLAPHCITPKFLHPLALPAEYLSATDENLTSETKGESSSSESSKMGLMRSTPSLRFLRHELKPHTAVHLQRSGSDDQIMLTQLPIYRAAKRCLTDFIQGQDIPLACALNMKTSSP